MSTVDHVLKLNVDRHVVVANDHEACSDTDSDQGESAGRKGGDAVDVTPTTHTTCEPETETRTEPTNQVSKNSHNAPLKGYVLDIRYLTEQTRSPLRPRTRPPLGAYEEENDGHAMMTCLVENLPLSQLSRFMANPSMAMWRAGIKVVQYLKGTPDLGIRYRRTGNTKVIAFLNVKDARTVQRLQENDQLLLGVCDSDLAGCPDTRMSHTGLGVFMAGGLVARRSVRQTVVALSSTEAEYMSTTELLKEVIYLIQILVQMGVKLDKPTEIFQDNQGCVAMSKNTLTKRSKHIDIKYHFIRQKVAEKVVNVTWIKTKNQIADIFTKALAYDLFVRFRNIMMGIDS